MQEIPSIQKKCALYALKRAGPVRKNVLNMLPITKAAKPVPKHVKNALKPVHSQFERSIKRR